MNMPIQAELPENLLVKALEMVHDGWVSNLNDLLADALRSYIDSHSLKLTDTFIREDVQWGLHGKD